VIGAATAVLKIFGGHINPTTVALAFLLIVLFVATAVGNRNRRISFVLAVACFNFFLSSTLRNIHNRRPAQLDRVYCFSNYCRSPSDSYLRGPGGKLRKQGGASEIERLYQRIAGHLRAIESGQSAEAKRKIEVGFA